VLLLAQLACGLILPFVLVRPLTSAPPGFWADAALSSSQIRIGVALAFAGGALTVALGVAAFSAFRRYSEATAHAFLAACIVSCALDFVHDATVIALMSLMSTTSTTSLPSLEPGPSQAVGSSGNYTAVVHIAQLVRSARDLCLLLVAPALRARAARAGRLGLSASRCNSSGSRS